MGLLKEDDKKTIQAAFELLQTPVKLLVFSQAMECTYCRETREIEDQ
jgi:hypothetical protein